MAATTSSIATSAGAQPRDALAQPQHLDAVGDLEDVGHVVADQDDGEPVRRARADQSSTLRVCTTPSAAVGSSMKTTLLAHVTAREIATPWRWPPDMFATGAVDVLDARRRGRWNASGAALAHRRACRGSRAGRAGRRACSSRPRNMFARGVELGREREVLVDGLDPERRAPAAACASVDRPALEEDLAAVGPGARRRAS